ncbi:hypothetical protein C8Q75DRAFT_522830 [Abortiporus biennis]|nr:hypothetical protein C8Q75DRAFT_522830 [Abortiporus biennis]
MAEHSDSTHDSSICSISEIDAALEGPIPPSLIAKLTPFDRRFLDHSDIFKKLLHLKRLYSKNPDVEARFERNRASFTGDGDLTVCYHRVLFEEVFAEINEKHNGIFGNGRVKYFLDLGCSPGGFSNWILGANMNAHGIGITLPDPEAPFALAVDDSHLVDQSRYHVRGVDLNSIVREAMDQGRDPVVPLDSADLNDTRSYDLVIAGAFPTRQGDKLWWERLVLVFSQLSIALSNLSPGGNLVFIIKTKVHRWLTEVIRLLRLSFTTLSAQKGQKLHAIRSSCYLICQDFIATQADIFAYNQSLHNALAKMTGDTVSSKPLHLFPEISDEELFMEEQEFVLPILEAVWMHQYNAMHFDLVRLSNSKKTIT